MSARILHPYQDITSGDMSAAVAGTPTDVRYLSQVSVQAAWDGVAASGYFTVGTVTADEAPAINGDAITAKESGATGDQFNIGASASETATNMAAAINASATFNTAYTAEAVGTKVYVTSKTKGNAGNALTLTSSTNVVRSGATLSGGGYPTGVLTLQGSMDYSPGGAGHAVAAAGTWFELDAFDSNPDGTEATGSALQVFMAIPVPWVRPYYTPTSPGAGNAGALNAYIAGKGL